MRVVVDDEPVFFARLDIAGCRWASGRGRGFGGSGKS
jgi:hypothetical protein